MNSATMEREKLKRTNVLLDFIMRFMVQSWIEYGEVRMEPTLQCDWCRNEFTPKKWWARFCSLKCRNGFHSHERKSRRAFLSTAAKREIAGLRKCVDGYAIVNALKLGRTVATSPDVAALADQLPDLNGNGHDIVEESAVAPVAEEPMKRRALT